MKQVFNICFWVTAVAFAPATETYAQGNREAGLQGAAWLKRADAHFTAGRFDSARFSYRQACSVLADHEVWRDYATALNGLAESDLYQGKFEAAIATLDTACAVEEQHAECHVLDRAQTYSLLAYAYLALEQWKRSQDFAEAGLTIRLSELGSDAPAVGPSQYMLGIVLYRLGDYSGAMGHLEEALRIQAVRPGRESLDFATTLVALGMASCDVGDYRAAVRSLAMAEEILTKNCDTRSATAGACYSYLANAYALMGERSLALQWANRSLSVYKRDYGLFHSELAGVYAVLGKIHGAIGDYDQAEDCYRESINLLIERFGEPNSRVGQMEWMLGSLYLKKGDLDSALHHSLRGHWNLRESLGPRHPDVLSLNKHIGSIYRERNESDSAIAHLRLALGGQEETGIQIGRLDIAEGLTILGQVHTQAGQFDSALTYLGMSLEIQGESGNQDPLVLSRTHRAIADVFEQRNLHNEALNSYRRAREVLKQEQTDAFAASSGSGKGRGYGHEMLHVLLAEGATYQNLAAAAGGRVPPLLNALRAYESAADLVEDLRRTYAREGSQLFLAEESLPLFEQGIRVSMDLFRATGEARYSQSAFSFAERSKAGILFDRIHRAQAMRYSGIPDSLLQRERQIRTDIVFCENQLDQPKPQRNASARSAMQEKLFELKQERALLEAGLDSEYPAYHEMQSGLPEITVQCIQALLDKNTSYLSYFVGDSTIWIFVVARGFFDAVMVQKPNDFELSVQRARKAIRTMNMKAYPTEAFALHQLLIRPIERLLGDRERLVIVPDGCLFYFPFEALVTALPSSAKASSGGWDYASLPFLVRSREISYAHSARLLVHIQRRRVDSSKEVTSFLGFAPVFRDTAEGRADLSDQDLLASGELPTLRSLRVNGKAFRELKYSEEEVRQIAADFDRRGYPSIAYFHGEATEENFRLNAASSRYIHLATHGYINEVQPDLSALLFSPRNDLPFSEDGLFYAGEAYNLQLDAELLVLSSCESGLGKMAKGEGLLAFTRGFQYAGARNIVYSLWKVLDRQTNVLMKDFYGGVLNGRRVSQALQQAKLKMISDRATAFPLFWAGFVLLGES